MEEPQQQPDPDTDQLDQQQPEEPLQKAKAKEEEQHEDFPPPTESTPPEELFREAGLTEWNLHTRTLPETLGALPALIDALLSQWEREVLHSGSTSSSLWEAIAASKGDGQKCALRLYFFRDEIFLPESKQQHRVFLSKKSHSGQWCLSVTVSGQLWKTVTHSWPWLVALFRRACQKRFQIREDSYDDRRCVYLGYYYQRDNQ